MRLEAPSGREVMRGHTSNLLFLKKKKIQREEKPPKHLFLFGRVFSNSTSIIMTQKRVPPPRTLLEVEEDGRAGRPLTGRVKDGDGETVPPRHAASREGEKETRRDGASAHSQTT